MTKKKCIFIITKNALIITILFIGFAKIAHAGERLTVAVPKANIRSGPGTHYDIIWQVYKYYPLRVIKKTGSWYRFFDFEGDKGWIYRSLVRKIPSVITIQEKCNIRSGPGTKYSVLFTTEKGVAFKVINRKGSWIHVRHSDGDKGWIYKSLVW
ncbi:MAG: SH3 domain-containing protein [Desulfobacterales bacterium]|jgi:SH3-like domain-containing protein